MYDSMARKIKELVHNGHNYPKWVLNAKISLTFRELLPTLSTPADRDAAFLDTFKFNALYIIRNHLHPDLK
jgi:hypothetical protein